MRLESKNSMVFWSLKTKSFRFLGREGSLRVSSDKRGVRINENSIIYSVRIKPSGAWFRATSKSNLWHVSKVRRHLMFQQISFLKAENVGIERTADGTARRSFPIGRTIRKLGGQMFTQIFTPMTWQNSSGSCTRGAATCTTWLLEVYAARITQSDKRISLAQAYQTASRAARGSSWELLVAQTETRCTHIARIVLRRQHLLSRHSSSIRSMRPQMIETVCIN